jgi:hypothetical protein
MNKQRKAILIASGLGVLASFSPWVKVPLVGSINGTSGDGDGWITFVLFAMTLVISLLGEKTKAIAGGLFYGAILPGLIAGVIGALNIIDINSKIAKSGLSGSISIGFGLYLVVIAGFALPILGFLIKDKAQDSN